MKFAAATVLLLLAAGASAGSALGAVALECGGERGAASGDRAITKVVKLLQNMLEKSKQDADTERKLYAKYKCYCDTNEAQKKATIEEYTKIDALLESNIAELKATNGVLSQEVGKLKADMEANQAARKEAQAIRDEENKAFLALEKDLVESIASMRDALEVLSAVGADQTQNTATGHEQYMAGFEGVSLARLRATVKQALLTASAFVSKKQSKTVEALIQAPFTGTYSAQSGEVVGILKDMRDTFKANLASARKTEELAVESYGKYMAAKEEEYNEMEAAYGEKQAQLSSNDEELSTKTELLEDARKTIAEAQGFLAKLLEMCAKKNQEYEHRVELRANEDVAISQAVAILNSDAAFETFGGSDAATTGGASFLQRRAVRQHRQRAHWAPDAVRDEESTRQMAQHFLQRAAGSTGSPLLAKVMTLLQLGNPFATVLAEIDKMLELIQREAAEDTKNKNWCDDERKKNNAIIAEKETQIATLQAEIDKLVDTIENPETGLKVQIATTEKDLETNNANQVSETKARTEENTAYQADIATLVEAQDLLVRAVEVLKRYYASIKKQEGAALLQHKEEPAPPSTWAEGGYTGRSKEGGSAIDMIEFILQSTKEEETVAHKEEETSQHAFEDSMQQLKQEEAELQKALADARELLAKTEEALFNAREDLAATQEAKKQAEEYLLSIKPGCDFITENVDKRTANRETESEALEKAKELLRGTPAFKEAMAVAHNETLGDCKDICAVDEAHAKCQACLAHVSVPGYCAGHAGTPGC